MAPKVGTVGRKSGFSGIPEKRIFGFRISGGMPQLELARRPRAKFRSDRLSRLASRAWTDKQTESTSENKGLLGRSALPRFARRSNIIQVGYDIGKPEHMNEMSLKTE